MNKKVYLVDLMIQLASNIVNEDMLTDLLKLQPEKIKLALETNNISQFKSCISNKQVFANETKVTIF